jgi:hypothetical protein
MVLKMSWTEKWRLESFCETHIKKIFLNKLKENPNFDSYVSIRNKYGIGSYSELQRKHKYGKRINTKVYLSKLNIYEGLVAILDDHYFVNVMRYKHFQYVDKYLEIIQQFVVKTNTFNYTPSLYYIVWHLIDHPEDPEGHFWHDGCFYLAMIFLGFEFKIVKRELKFKCKINK